METGRGVLSYKPPVDIHEQSFYYIGYNFIMKKQILQSMVIVEP